LAVSFCPGSAAIFFGGLVPLAGSQSSAILLPVLYGLGAAGPVVAMAFLAAYATGRVARAFDRLRQAERWARWLTGLLLIGVGAYDCLTQIFGLALGRGT